MNKSIFEGEFYRPLLAMGHIPVEEKMPSDLLQAMAILIRRSMDVYIVPSECASPAALVLLAFASESRSPPYLKVDIYC